MRQAIWFVGLTAALGCDGDVLGTDGALELSVAVARPVIASDQVTTAIITLRNSGAIPITVTTGGCVLLPSISVESSGEVVYPGSKLFCPAVVRAFRLGPGAEQTQQLLVGGEQASPPTAHIALPRGSYLIKATLQSSDHPLRSAPARLTVE
jgi:hypothetical protein